MDKVLEIFEKIKDYNSIHLSDDEERFIDYLLKINKISVVQRFSFKEFLEENGGDLSEEELNELNFKRLEEQNDIDDYDETDYYDENDLDKKDITKEYVQSVIDDIFKKANDKFGSKFVNQLQEVVDMAQHKNITCRLMDEAAKSYISAESARLNELEKLFNLTPQEVTKIETELSKRRFTDERNTRELQKHFYICACNYLKEKNFYNDKTYDAIIDIFNGELSPIAIIAIKKRYNLTTPEVIGVVENIGTDIIKFALDYNLEIAKKIIESDQEIFDA